MAGTAMMAVPVDQFDDRNLPDRRRPDLTTRSQRCTRLANYGASTDRGRVRRDGPRMKPGAERTSPRPRTFDMGASRLTLSKTQNPKPSPYGVAVGVRLDGSPNSPPLVVGSAAGVALEVTGVPAASPIDSVTITS
jgi:hypothetical protein